MVCLQSRARQPDLLCRCLPEHWNHPLQRFSPRALNDDCVKCQHASPTMDASIANCIADRAPTSTKISKVLSFSSMPGTEDHSIYKILTLLILVHHHTHQNSDYVGPLKPGLPDSSWILTTERLQFCRLVHGLQVSLMY